MDTDSIYAEQEDNMEKYASIDDFFAAHRELDKTDVKKHYVKGKCELWYPVIAQDGRPHLKHAVVQKAK